MKYIDEQKDTRFDFEINLNRLGRHDCYKPYEVFLISFHGIGIGFRYVVANFLAVLKLLFGFDKYHYVPMRHIESVGFEIEFTVQGGCIWYMVNYENGRKFRRAGTEVKQKYKILKGCLEVKSIDGSYCVTMDALMISRDFEHTHTLIEIWQNEELLSDFETNLNLN